MDKEIYWKRVVISFPILLSVGILLIPVVSDYSNHALAEEASKESIRWLSGHVVSVVAVAAWTIYLPLAKHLWQGEEGS